MARLRLLLAVLFCVAQVHASAAEEISGSGSTFAFPVVAGWADAYAKATGTQIKYQPIGSGAGVSEIRARLVDFAVSDAPLVDSQLLRDGLMQFPLVVGAIVPVINLEGVAPGQLHLTGEVLVGIYLGRIARWNDLAITELNPGLTLPNLPITVIYRSDASGTTLNWTDYLAKVSTTWFAAVGSNLTVHWPVGFGAKGNGGVAEKISRVKGAIGYVEYTYAIKSKLSFALVRNHAGNYVAPSEHSFRSTVDAVDWMEEADFHVLLADAAASDAYPMMATSFVLMPSYPRDMQQTRATLGFFRWALNNGQEIASSLHYLPLPPELTEQVEAYWSVSLPRN
jgi:phosphate transport system substrate-binding protein